jgi:hypothetical protein
MGSCTSSHIDEESCPHPPSEERKGEYLDAAVLVTGDALVGKCSIIIELRRASVGKPQLYYRLSYLPKPIQSLDIRVTLMVFKWASVSLAQVRDSIIRSKLPLVIALHQCDQVPTEEMMSPWIELGFQHECSICFTSVLRPDSILHLWKTIQESSELTTISLL